MNNALRKSSAMYRYFGKNEGHICGECENLAVYCHRDKTYRKCKVYGITSSEASDWTKSWCACGMFNQDYTGRAIIKTNRKDSKQNDTQIDGQVSLEGIYGAD